MEQTQNRISDERLAEIANGYARLSTSQKESGGVYWPEAASMARELTALRASHMRLVEALERAQTLLSATVKFIDANPIGEYTVHYDEAECDGLCLADDCRTAESSAHAALAEARKLEGE